MTRRKWRQRAELAELAEAQLEAVKALTFTWTSSHQEPMRQWCGHKVWDAIEKVRPSR